MELVRADSLRAEVERLRTETERLQQERDQAYRLLAGLERLGQGTLFWDGMPEHLSNLVAQIRQAFGYDSVSISLFESGRLHRKAIDPPDAPWGPELESPDLDQTFQQGKPGFHSSSAGHRLIVPLTDGIQRVGVLEIALNDAPAPLWISLWRTLATQVTSIVAGGRQLTELEQAQRRQQLVCNFTRCLTSGQDVDTLLADILGLTIPCTGAETGSIMLLSSHGQVTRCVLTRKHLSREEKERAVQEVLNHGLARWVIDNRVATIVADTALDPRWITLPGDTVSVRSVLAAPLMHGDDLRGLLFLVHPAPNHFTDEHQAFLSAIAEQSAIALENAQLIEQTQQRLDELALLNEISQAASSLYLNDVLRIVTERMTQALQIRRCGVFLLDNTCTRLVLRAVNNPGVADNAMDLTVSLEDHPHIDQAIKTRRPAEIPDVLADVRLMSFWDKARELDIGAQLAVPLIAKQRVIGAIGIDRGMGSPPFTEGEIALCQTIAHQAANAIENAQLYEELQRRAERLWLANRVSHDIGVVLDIEVLLREVIRLIRNTLDCYHVAVALIEGDELVFRAGINYLQQPTPQIRVSLAGERGGIAGWVARNGTSLLVADVAGDARHASLEELPDTRCELAVPLRLPERTPEGTVEESRTIGVLDVRSTQVEAFSSADRDLLEAVASQVAVAIESARLFGRVREERATLEAIINGTDEAIIVTDTSDRILFFNPAARSAFVNGETLIPGGLLCEAVRHHALLEFWNGSSQSTVRSAEIPLADGRTFNASMTCIAGVGKVAVMQDITHLKEMDRVKSEFVSTVSHDLRSPLQVIQTSAELLPRLGGLSLEQRKEVERILAVVRRMSELVRDLLDIGRIEAGIGMETEPCAIDEIIASAAGSYRALAQRKGLGFTVNLPPTLPLVRANPLRLDQVVSNLVSNAIKFTPEGSVTVTAHANGAQVVIEIIDTGIGIPPEAREGLFEKFYRVKSPQTYGIQGTGLGLAIAKSIVESYGGRIELESYPRLGSTFRVILPTYQNQVT